MSPLISVVMCCYNAEKYINKSIDSILSQTFKDFEFIIWNDGSSDSTEDIIKSYKDERIRHYYHQNTGLGMALRLACAEAKGKYIARMDADDISFPIRFEEEIKYMEKHMDVVLVSSAVKYIDDDGNILGRSFPYTNDDVICKVLDRGDNVIVHPASLFRKDYYDISGGYYPLKKAQDLLLFSRFAKLGKVANIPYPLIYYRLSPGSISTQTMGSSFQEEWQRIMNKMIHDDNVSEEDVNQYNEVVEKMKQEKRNNPDLYKENIARYQRSVEERLFSLIKPFLGTSLSTTVITNLKNTYGRFKYK